MINPQELYAKIREGISRKKPPEDDFGSLDDQIGSLPQSEKLTPLERGIYKALPGVSENWAVQKLAQINENWLGEKIFQGLDILAEGVERSVGLLSQMREKDFNINELKSGWYAGSLSYDVSNLPVAIHGDKRRVKDN